MKLPFPAAAAAALILGAALPALAQQAPAPATPPVAQPQAAAPADAQAPTRPVVRPAGSRGDCPWKSKNLTS